MGVVTFNGITSQTYGIQVEHPPEYQTPERDYSITSVPGRSGDLVQDNGSYKNVDRTYQIAVGSLTDTYVHMANQISNWLHSASGYLRLEDTYEPDYFRLAMYQEANLLSNLFQHAGRATINFNCKPQRYLKTGSTKIVALNNGIITNPTTQIALPLIRVYGSGNGAINIGAYTVFLTGIVGYIDIDSEIQDSYKGLINMNSYVTLVNTYPKLVPGNSTFTCTENITSVEVTPRWWTI